MPPSQPLQDTIQKAKNKALKKPPRKHATVLTDPNGKGGSCKTFTLFQLLGVCEKRGLRCLLIETDRQGNVSKDILEEERDGPGTEALFDPGLATDPHALVRRSTFAHIDVIPGTPALEALEETSRTQWEKYDLHLALIPAIEKLRPTYDYIFLDPPGSLSLMSYACLCCADFAVVPLEVVDWGAQGVRDVTAIIEHIKQHYNPHLTLLGYIPSRFRRARETQQTYLTALRENYGSLTFDTVIPDLAEFERSVVNDTPVVLHAPHSEEAAIITQLFDEIASRAKQAERKIKIASGQDVCQGASGIA